MHYWHVKETDVEKKKNAELVYLQIADETLTIGVPTQMSLQFKKVLALRIA
jgi:hypothetical protein